MPLVLLLSFLGSSNTVFASGMSDFTYSPVDWDNDISKSSTISYQFRPVSVIDEYNRTYHLYYNAQTGEYSLGETPTGGAVSINFNGWINFRTVYSIYNPNFSTATFGVINEAYTATLSNLTLGDTLYLSIVSIDSDNNYSDISTVSSYGTTHNTINCLNNFKFDSNFLDVSIVSNVRVNLNVEIRLNNVSNNNMNSYIDSILNNSIGASLSSTNLSGHVFLSDYSLYEILNTFDTKLYNLWITDNLIYDQLVWNGNHNFASSLAGLLAQDSNAEQNAINSAASQAASDAAIAQSQAADIIDNLNYDHSGTSQSVSATQSAYDAAQGAADSAVDAAVHNYTSDLSTVEAYDYSSFFTSQRNSAVFWRDVCEYILDSSNLGFVSGSIIIVTLIGLVIFMLRL